LLSTIGGLGYENKPLASISEQRPEAPADCLNVFQSDLSKRNLQSERLDIERF
jgi:hypothetical protein